MSYSSEYYQKNKSHLLERAKVWRKANREKIREQKRLYESRPDRKLKKREKGIKDYQANRDRHLTRQAKRRRERKAFMDGICLYYGCRNPDCKWDGEYQPCQLDFHHFNPDDKLIEVAKMESWSYDKIVAEIDKCVVVCRNCHPLVHNGTIHLNENMKCKYQAYASRASLQILSEVSVS